MKGYMYTVNINQFAAVENGFNIDIIDLAIFDFFRSFANSGHCSKMDDPLGSFFQVQNSLIMQQIPLLKIKTDRGIAKRIDNLVKAGLLKKHPNNSKLNKTWYCFGSNYDKMLFYNNLTQIEEPQNESSDTPERKFRPPQNESSDNNIYKYNSYKKNISYAKGDTQPYLNIQKKIDFSSLTDEEKKERIEKMKEAFLNDKAIRNDNLFTRKKLEEWFKGLEIFGKEQYKTDLGNYYGGLKTFFKNYLKYKANPYALHKKAI